MPLNTYFYYTTNVILSTINFTNSFKPLKLIYHKTGKFIVKKRIKVDSLERVNKSYTNREEVYGRQENARQWG